PAVDGPGNWATAAVSTSQHKNVHSEADAAGRLPTNEQTNNPGGPMPT
ncbi:hypothetical protein HMPREF9566_02590, partial [Cutibacterium acnes HL045PA1]